MGIKGDVKTAHVYRYDGSAIPEDTSIYIHKVTYHFNEEGNLTSMDRVTNLKKYDLGIKTYHRQYSYENEKCSWIEVETTEKKEDTPSSSDSSSGKFIRINDLEFLEEGHYSKENRFENRTVLNPDFTEKSEHYQTYQGSELIQDMRLEFMYQNQIKTKLIEHDLLEDKIDTVSIIALETDKYQNALRSKLVHSDFKPSTARLMILEFY